MTIVRLVWAALVVFGGTGILLYIIAAIVIPKESNDRYSGSSYEEPESTSKNNGTYSPSSNSRGGLVIGLILIAIGAFIMLNRIIPFNLFRLLGSFIWPLILVGAGLALIITAVRR